MMDSVFQNDAIPRGGPAFESGWQWMLAVCLIAVSVDPGKARDVYLYWNVRRFEACGGRSDLVVVTCRSDLVVVT